ncbi:MAG: hypothetical protein PHU66_02745 [Bacteroidaceae bacterium]|nr:hypothetical protein [Bacteroidaceae bacterium]
MKAKRFIILLLCLLLLIKADKEAASFHITEAYKTPMTDSVSSYFYS